MLLTDNTSPIFELIQSARQTEDESRERGGDEREGARGEALA